MSEPTVTTNPATSVKKETATLNGHLSIPHPDPGESGECWFEYGLDTSYGTTTPIQYKLDGDDFSQAINGLEWNTTYHFRAVANTFGPMTMGYGADRTFKTKGAVLGNILIDQLIYQHCERMVR